MFLFCKRWNFTLKNRRNASKQNAVPWCYSSWDPLDISYSLTVWIRSFFSSFANWAIGTADFSVWLVNKEIREKLISSAQAELHFFPSCFAKQQWQRRWTRPKTSDLLCLGSIDSSFSLFFSKNGSCFKRKNSGDSERSGWKASFKMSKWKTSAPLGEGKSGGGGRGVTKLDPKCVNNFLLPRTAFLPKFVIHWEQIPNFTVKSPLQHYPGVRDREESPWCKDMEMQG